MKRVFLLMLIISFAFGSCKKDKAECEINNTGELSIYNNANEPYTLYINGVEIKTLIANSNFTLTRTAGITYTLELQETNFIIFPTDYTSKWNCVQCITDTWSPVNM